MRRGWVWSGVWWGGVGLDGIGWDRMGWGEVGLGLGLGWCVVWFGVMWCGRAASVGMGLGER